MLDFTGERIVPHAKNCEPVFANKMFQEHIARYVFASRFIIGKKVLDVGCGVGYGARYLAENGAASIVAFDISIEAISHAKEHYSASNLEFRVASATNFDFGERYDVITCFELIEHVDAQTDVIRCIRKALKEDGILIISTPRALEQKRTYFHTREFSEQEFRLLLADKFSAVKLYYENNHFVSLITGDQPQTIDSIITLQDQWTLACADYFVAVAHNCAVAEIGCNMRPVMVVNDDQYVRLLERDVAILHEAEKSINHTLERTSHELLGLKNSRSWKITSPLRYCGKTLRQMIYLCQKVGGYRKTYGTWRMLRAVRERLLASLMDVDKAKRDLVIKQGELDIRAIARERLDVLFLIGCWDGESKRYRVHNMVEGLRALGYRVHEAPFAQLDAVVEAGLEANIVVLFRAPFDPTLGINNFFAYAKQHHIKVVFDVDDLIFDPSVVESIDGFRMLSEDKKARYLDGVSMYRQMLLASDLVTVPTEYLKSQVNKLGVPAAIIPNSVNAKQIAIAQDVVAAPRESGNVVRIGYFSGSYTHQKDFSQCESALLELMGQHSDIVLRIVGYMDLDSRWDGYAQRVERVGFLPYCDMLKDMAQCDINIAPLEPDSPFCHAKSELKFFEAGLVGVPTVASATDTFVRAINHGVDGYCVNTTQQWREALNGLITSKVLRTQIGAKARESALGRYTVERVVADAVKVYGLGAPHKDSALVASEREADHFSVSRLKIAWVIPGLIIGGGGHRNILRAAYFLQKFGHQVSLYFTATEKAPQEIKKDIQKHFYALDCPVYRFEGSIQPADVVFATHWSTVSAALTAHGNAREIMYFVQDFEPYFAPMGTEYILAENTYRLGLYHITSGPWCEMILRREFSADADHFIFPVDRSVYHQKQRQKQNLNLVFFAKPEMPRRCFNLGVIALRHFHLLCPDVEIIMFGSRHLNKQQLDFPATMRDVVPTLDELAQMYSDADVGLVFSTTNPSLIPYEMMACGLPVVDLRRGENAVNYGGRSDIAKLADPRPEKLAEEIAELISNKEELARRRDAGLEFVGGFPSEEQMARRIESLIQKRVEIGARTWKKHQASGL
jgi:2-polyprenyl-3-methyl-5-hydroxy-6-metoxy-1,4-benzoquinol methylase/glycosyltransferase involved in cell wall biosynthesis